MRRLAGIVLTLLGLACLAGSAVAQEADIWPELRNEIFDSRPIAEETGVISLTAPDRAEDAATVPITITLPSEVAERARAVTLIIEQNPAPVAAKFTLGAALRLGQQQLTTRVRVDRYTFIRAVLEMANGELHMTSRFVKASGGCSAPASKDPEAALADIGRIKVSTRSLGEAETSRSEAQVMIKHPNFSGLQMDEVTRAYTPARFVSEIEMREAGELVLKVEGGISISENPHFTLSYAPRAGNELVVTAKDTDGAVFTVTHRQSGS